MAFRSLAVVLVVAVSTVLAQSNPLIPSGISATCAAHLSALNANTQIQSCLTPITTALAAFSPTSNLASCSSSTVNTALTSICPSSSSNACPQSVFTSELTAFYANCSVELTSSPNIQVKLIYDALYAFFPFRQAVCSKDDNGDYCVTKLPSNSSTTKSALYTPSASNSSIMVPNTATFQAENILFLLYQSSMPSSELCTACVRNVMASYINFESNALYGPGLQQSVLLVGQSGLYGNITSVCGSNFLNGAVAAAGGLSQGVVGAASRIGVQELSSAVGAILGVAGLVAASL